MSAVRQVLVHFFDADHSRETLRLGTQMAHAHGAELRICIAIDSVSGGAYLSPETAAMATQLAVEQVQALKASATGQLSQLTQANPEWARVPAALDISTADPLNRLVTASLGADLLLLRQPEPDVGLGQGVTARLLVGAACPVLVLPHIGLQQPPGRSILVAWSRQRESSRAVRDALFALRAAQSVEFLSLQENADSTPAWEELQAWLKRHALKAQCTRLPARSEGSLSERLRRGWEPDASIAETLLSHAADSGADLIVCGAYGHSRAWEFVLGGVTDTLLRSMTVPVLFSH